MSSARRIRPADAAAPAPVAGIVAALGTLYVVWGSTYLGIRVTVLGGIPPLIGMGTRFVVAPLLLAAVLAALRGPASLRVTRRELRGCAVVGAFLLVGGNGLVAVAEEQVPSGLAALLVSATPLWLVLLRAASRDVPRLLTWVGTAVGFGGVAVLVLPGGAGGGAPLGPSLLVVLASLLWAVGSLASGRLTMPRDPFTAAVHQMWVGGLTMLVLSVVRGEWGRFSPSEVTPDAALAWVYLVVAGALVAYTAYYWVLRAAPVSLVSTYAYVNPVVAVALGAWLLGEVVASAVVVGGVLAVAGVALVITSERRRSGAPAPTISRHREGPGRRDAD